VTEQEGALVQLAGVLESGGIPYAVIGGMANAVWGVPRATLDVDATVWIGEEDPARYIGVLSAAFAVRPQDPVAFVRETRVLPLETRDGVRIDLVFGLIPFEEDAVRRAVPRAVAGATVRFCTAEDLILMKLVSERPKDLDDARGILAVQAGRIDRAYLDPRVDELADLLARPGIREAYVAALSRRPPQGA